MEFDYFSPNEIFIQDYNEEFSMLYFNNNAIFDLVNIFLVGRSGG